MNPAHSHARDGEEGWKQQLKELIKCDLFVIFVDYYCEWQHKALDFSLLVRDKEIKKVSESVSPHGYFIDGKKFRQARNESYDGRAFKIRCKMGLTSPSLLVWKIASSVNAILRRTKKYDEVTSL